MRSQILFPIFALVGALHASDLPDGAALSGRACAPQMLILFSTNRKSRWKWEFMVQTKTMPMTFVVASKPPNRIRI